MALHQKYSGKKCLAENIYSGDDLERVKVFFLGFYQVFERVSRRISGRGFGRGRSV